MSKLRESNVYPGWDLYRDGITQGALYKFIACPEKFRMSFQEGYSSKSKGDAMIVGDAFHQTLDAFYTRVRDQKEPNFKWAGPFIKRTIYGLIEKANEALHKEFAAPPSETVQKLQDLHLLAGVMLEEYVDYWSKDYFSKEWVDLEREFRVPYKHSSGNIPMNGKMDGTYRAGKKKRLRLFETKTKGQVEDAQILDRMAYEIQVMMYLEAMRKLYGEAPAGVLYNIVRRPLLRQKAGEGGPDFRERCREDMRKRPEFYFIRYNVSIRKEERIKWKNEFASMIDQLVRWYQNEFHYRNPGSCTLYNRSCEFMRHCASPGNAQAFQFLKRRETVFPELQGIEE